VALARMGTSILQGSTPMRHDTKSIFLRAASAPSANEAPDETSGKAPDETSQARWKTKYDMAAALSYRPGKHSAETRLIDRVFAQIPVGSLLDIPCGNGRFSIHLARKGYAVSAADYSCPMLELARAAGRDAGLPFPVFKADVENLGLAERQFESVLCFRLFHHFPEASIRRQVVAEICRVAEKYVAISYFSLYSFSSLKRELGKHFLGKKIKKHANTLSEMDGYFNAQGFGRVQDFPLLNFIHTLHVALYRRIE
jgi:2-polyprenyl-3-methyl-5-hydroxy-6-metoxy-1,4-benzoquinol methylase